jgi:hypothetical protein
MSHLVQPFFASVKENFLRRFPAPDHLEFSRTRATRVNICANLLLDRRIDARGRRVRTAMGDWPGEARDRCR